MCVRACEYEFLQACVLCLSSCLHPGQFGPKDESGPKPCGPRHWPGPGPDSAGQGQAGPSQDWAGSGHAGSEVWRRKSKKNWPRHSNQFYDFITSWRPGCQLGGLAQSLFFLDPRLVQPFLLSREAISLHPCVMIKGLGPHIVRYILWDTIPKSRLGQE